MNINLASLIFTKKHLKMDEHYGVDMLLLLIDPLNKTRDVNRNNNILHLPLLRRRGK